MANVLTIPASGNIYFSNGTAGSSTIPTLTGSASGVSLGYDGYAGVLISSSATGVSGLNRLTIAGSNGTLFNVSDELTGSIFTVNDIGGLPILEVTSTTSDKFDIAAFTEIEFTGAQLRLSYNPSNYTDLSVASNGDLNINSLGEVFVNAPINVTDFTTLSDGALINGNLEVSNQIQVGVDLWEINGTGNKLRIGYPGDVALYIDADNQLTAPAQTGGSNDALFTKYLTYTNSQRLSNKLVEWLPSLAGYTAITSGSATTTTSSNSASVTTGTTANSFGMLYQAGFNGSWYATDGLIWNFTPNWSRPVAIRLTIANGTATYGTGVSGGFRFGQTRSTTNTELTVRGVGLKIFGSGVYPYVHDGTSQTTGSDITTMPQGYPRDILILGDGSGTYKFYVNEILKATITGGPTGYAGGGNDTSIGFYISNGIHTTNYQLASQGPVQIQYLD